MSDRKFLVDTNVLVDAKNKYFGFGFCPAFWDWLVLMFEAGIVFSVKAVLDEINNYAVRDDLQDWADRMDRGFFLSSDKAADTAYFGVVTDWAYLSSGKSDVEVRKFLEKADSSLISKALAHGHTVVSLETSRQRKGVVKIPAACKGLGIECIDTFELLRRFNPEFVLSAESRSRLNA